jgi:hypothetical protein
MADEVVVFLRKSLLIPVPVTGIQSTRICAAERDVSAQGLGLAGFL